MILADLLRKECIVTAGQVKDKSCALRLVARMAKKSAILKDVDEESILAGLQEREALGSTGFGNGIAIPHCRLDSISDFVVGIVAVPSGVDFDAIDKDKVKLIIFIIAPSDRSNAHIRLLSLVSQTLLSPGVVEEVVSQTTPTSAYESFVRHTRVDIETKGDEGDKDLFYVIVQDEGVFQDIVEKMAGIESSWLVVLDAENTSAYLSRIPLFAGFWHDTKDQFNKIILAVVDKGLSNETLRRIESVTGDLKKRSGVMVVVQPISYCAGLLNAG